MSKKDALACQVSLGLFAGLLGIASTAHGAPSLDDKGVRAGGAKVHVGTTTTIESQNTNNVIGWKDFSVKSGESVVFDSGAKTNNYLNIVTGNVTSHIDGKMRGGNNVYIANSHGVIFGDGASVDVGNLYVTTRKLDADSYTIAPDMENNPLITVSATTKAADSSAAADVVSLIDGSGSLKANKIVLEGRSVRIMNNAALQSQTSGGTPEVYALADTRPLKAGKSDKEVRSYTGYVHVGHTNSGIPSNPLPTVGSGGKYKNLTQDNLYKLIGSEYELEHMELNKNYMLRSNIALTGTHTPIGTSTAPFTGKFDGMFHEISGLTFDTAHKGTSTEYVGLFGTTNGATNGATIMNVGLKNADLSRVEYGGGLVGHAKGNTVISAVYNESTTSIGAGSYAGGIVGMLDGSSLDHAYNTATVTQGGGLAGAITGNVKIYAVYNTGTTTGGVSAGVYQVLDNYVAGSFIKDAYTTTADLTPSTTQDFIFNSYTKNSNGKASLVVPSGTSTTGDAKQATTYEGWDISDEGGANTTWRIFAGRSTPLLTAFMQGTVQAEYSYAEFEQTNHGHSGNNASAYTDKIADTVKKNNGESMPWRTYDARYRKILKKDGSGEAGSASDVDIIGYTAPSAASDPKEIKLDADHGRRNAGKAAVLYSGQHGYDVTGANIEIKKRSVTAGLGTDRPIEREYNGDTDMTPEFKGALTGITTNGLVADDDVTIDTANSTLTASVTDANAGYGKALTLSGKLTYKGADRVNYEEIDATSGALKLPSNLTANIRQKTVTIGFKPGKNFNKTYDGTSDVKDEINPKKPTGANVLELTGVAAGEDLKLNNSDITAKYMKDKSSDADENALGNAKVNRDIAYKNIKLADGTTGKAKNYRLVDDKGNVLYREKLADEPSTAGDAVTSGTLWGTGTISRRNINKDTFLWNGGAATKEYDGSTEWIKPNGASDADKKITAKKAGDTSVNNDEGLIQEDVDKIDFTLESGKGEFRDGTTATKNVSEAKKVAYQVTATNKNADEDVLSNYKIGGENAVSGGKYDVTSEGKITPRVIDIDLIQKTGIDKTYDGTVDAVEGDDDHKYLTMGKKWVGYASGSNTLVGDTDNKGIGSDGATIKVEAVYRQKGTAIDDKNVVRGADNVVTPNGKDVYYTFTLNGGNAATNYTFNADGQTAQATKNMTGTGTITPKKLTLASPGDVTRAYDGTSKVYKSQLLASYTNVTNGVEVGDTVHLNFGTGTTVVGTYYTNSTLATEAKDANADKNGALKAGKQNYTVKYTFTPTLDNGNYEVDAATPPTGLGTIKQLEVTNANFEMDFGEKTKTFNGTTTVEGGDPLSALKIGGVDLLNTPGSYTLVGGRYSDEHATHDKDGTRLAGKSKLAVTYTISLPGENRGNYDFSGFITSGEYTKTGNMYDGYTISRTRPGVGSIRQRLINPTVAKPLVTKDYNGKRDVVDGNGNPSGSASLVNMPELIPGKGSNVSKAEYIDKNVGKNKTVTYTPAISDNYKSDYYFSVASLTGQGNIDPLQIDVNFKRANKTYDGTADVNKAASDWGYEFVPQRRDPLFSRTAGIIADDVTNGELKFDTDKLTAQYVDANGNPQSDAGNYENRVRYGNIQNALTSSNYQIVNVGSTNIVPTNTKWGSGTITKRTVHVSDIKIAIDAATKVYDGTTAVKKAGNASDAKDYIQHFKMNLDGTIGWTDYELGKDYSLDGAAYDNANVASNNGTGTVRYRLSLKNSDGTDGVLSKNYDFTNLPENYTYDSSTGILTRTTVTNTITKRPVYAHVVNENVTKTYNAKKDVIDGNNNALTGESLVHFERASEGTADRGLLDADKNRNATKAVYDTKAAGTGKTVNYTLLFSDNATVNNDLSANYELQDGNGNATTTLQTTTNTINRRALKLKADPVTKDYDAKDIVKVGGTPSTTGVGLAFVGGDLQTNESNAQDIVNLGNAYTRKYDSPNATRSEASKKNNVTYSGIKLVAGGDAANYFLADGDGKALTGNDTAGYTMKGDGVINPLKVKKDRFKLNFRKAPVEKTYDGTANVGVGDATYNQPANLEGYIESAYVTKADGVTKLFDIGIEKVNSATYRTGVAAGSSDGTADKNAADGKKVLFNLKFSDAAQNNFEFDSDFYSGSAGTDRMLRGDDGSSTYNVYATGDIKKRILTAALGQTSNIRKVYDGGLEADKGNLSANNLVEADKNKLDKSAVFDRSNASVSPGETANARTITYTATLTGDAVGNYAFDSITGSAQKVLTATGDIEKRKVYARVTAPRVKTYDATTKVLIDGADPISSDALVTLGRNNRNDADTGLVDGKGANKTTAVYAGANAADASDSPNKQVDYKLAIDGSDADGAFADNYIVYDESGNVVYNTATGRDTLTTYDNTINRAPLKLTAEYAEKQYDGGRRVKNPSHDSLLNIRGGWQGSDSGDLNRSGTGSYTATYLDENVNEKGVDYGNIQIVGTGTKPGTKPAKASNYYLSYNDTKLKPSSSETYALHGDGAITKRMLKKDDLHAGFTTTPIKKTYDGTTDVKDPAQYVQYMRTRYKKDDGTDLDLAANGYTVERADYLAKSPDAAAKDVGEGKDVKFQFALHDGNFDYTGLTGWQPDANGVYHFSEDYGRDAEGVGRGEIIGRRVALTLHLVQKVYDGTKDVGTKNGENNPYMRDVKNGYYTKDEKTGKLVEHNPNLDWKKVITLDGDGKIGGDENSGFAHGEGLDFNATGEYKDANANRDPHYTGPLQPANKDVTYKMRLKDATANKNYSFQIRVVDEAGNTLKTATSQSFIDPQTGEGHMFDGLGNIWQKQLTLTKTNGWGKNYDGNADVTDAVKKGLQFDGVAQSDTGFFNFSDPANARANTFTGKLSGRYGDRAVEGSFLDTPGNTAVYKHVKRPQGNLNGTPEARDVELTGVKDALASLQAPGSVANNYFYDGDNTVYGTGVIKPLTLDLKKTWLKNGADFSKTYDGDPLAKIGGKALSLENKQAFHDKLNLSVDLGTGERPIELDYTLYGDEEGDYVGYRPHYENLSGGHAHHGQSDANVKNSADPADTLNKDIVYKLKRINGDKAWANQAEGDRYKDWELSENPSGADLRLSDAATDTHTDNKSGLRAVITPKKVEVQADAYSKIYDGTSSLTAPSLSAGELAKKQQELRSKLHVTDEEAAKMLKEDGIDFTVDTDSSQFLDKTSRLADANVARDAAGNTLRDAEGNIPADGKLVEYRLQKTGDVVKQGNYELPSAALPSGVQTDAVLGAGSITPRLVRTAFDPASTAAPDKIYDGTQYAVKDGKIHSRTFHLVDAAGDEGVIAADAGDVKLNQTQNFGRFASPNVKKDENGVQAQDVTYNEGIALTNGQNKAGNYTLDTSNLKDSAKITPRPITATLKNEPIVKEYDGTKEVQDLRRYIGKDAKGKAVFETTTALREGNINLADNNAAVEGISAPALPIWSSADKEKGLTLTNALYDNENVGENKRVTYDIGLNSDNYTLVDAAGSSLTSGDRTAQIVSNRGEIDRRKVFFGVRKDANKIYDGTTDVRKPLDDLKFTYNGTSAAPDEESGIVEKDRKTLNDALRVRGVYTDDANAADSDDDSPKTHDVRYSFEKDEVRDPVLSKYEIATAKGDNTIDGKGVIRRRTLDVLPDWQATYAGKSSMNYTGRIADGANEDSPLTDEVKRDLQSFNSGVFSYGPKDGVDYRTPYVHDILGWYTKNGKKTLASGNYTYVDGSNYTLRSVPSKLFIAPRVDSIVPERTIRPDSKVYQRAAFDESNVFGKNKDLDAALAYTGEGVNIGGMKSQQGTSTNASDAGIRQQGTGTNISGSAGVGGTAGVNGKVQGATGAANEAARAAGAQPGAAVKPQGTTGGNAALAGGAAGSGGYYSPSAQSGASVKAQGAQSGASVKPQGTTGGNAALAGGTADLGGYYSPGAQPGASVKPQGAKSGAAGKPQGAVSAVGSAGSTVGAGSVVDRGLAAAAGMSVGSSSDARTGASGSRRSADYSSGAGFYADGSSRAADRGLANALGRGAGYYNGKGYSHTDDDEEEEIKKKTKKASA
ncbi:YDG domain-containing protein [Selenomonas sputigena]|uniref:two-partner secretion domain-containing protein n=1 Tax=Selenomonas sputigena TaxID=69823 RepID=UPI0022322EAB|nr:filamentous hemagglutinin N-terminal domain-containing protein [Selenomonas sputigena]UZD42974.1 YDG domain-containing protein [Selenomonas sputigena]